MGSAASIVATPSPSSCASASAILMLSLSNNVNPKNGGSITVGCMEEAMRKWKIVQEDALVIAAAHALTHVHREGEREEDGDGERQEDGREEVREEELSASSDEYMESIQSIPNSPTSATGQWATKCVHISKMCADEETTYDFKGHVEDSISRIHETLEYDQIPQNKIGHSQTLHQLSNPPPKTLNNIDTDDSMSVKLASSTTSRLWNRRRGIEDSQNVASLIIR